MCMEHKPRYKKILKPDNPPPRVRESYHYLIAAKFVLACATGTIGGLIIFLVIR